MPPYSWLADSAIDVEDTVVKVKAMKTLGVPYTADEIANCAADAEGMGKAIAADLKEQGVVVKWDSEMVALIAYLQRLGKHPDHPSLHDGSLPTGRNPHDVPASSGPNTKEGL